MCRGTERNLVNQIFPQEETVERNNCFIRENIEMLPKSQRQS